MRYMSTAKTLEFVSNSLEETCALAEKIGAKLRGGETIELISDLGGGKTAFVRGLARGIGSADQVASPTFTISRHYRSLERGIELHHFDFYRLSEPELMEHELAESVDNPSAAVAVEWPQTVQDILPKDRLVVEISALGEETRLIKISAGPSHARLIDGLKRP